MVTDYGNYGAPPPSQGGYGGNVGYGQGGGGGGYGQPPPSYGPPSGGGYSQAPAPYESNTQYGQPQGPPSYNRSAPPAGGGYGGPPPSYGGESGGYGGGSSGLCFLCFDKYMAVENFIFIFPLLHICNTPLFNLN